MHDETVPNLALPTGFGAFTLKATLHPAS